MKRTTTAGAFGAALGLAAIASITPGIVSGDARDAAGGTGAAAAALERPFLAMLSGAEEVPGPGDPDGTGAAAITINPVDGSVCFDLRVAGIAPANAAHIHEAPKGAIGPVVVPLAPPTTGTSSGCVTTTPEQAAEIVATPANYYVNVHNPQFPDGALRGQLAASTATAGTLQVLAEPLRAYDSRTDTQQGTIDPNETRVVNLGTGRTAAGTMAIAVPPGATAAMVKLTVTDTVGAGWLKIYSNALTTPPATASVNWYEPGAIIGETGPVAVDASGLVKVTAGFGTTHFVVDVVGYVY